MVANANRRICYLDLERLSQTVIKPAVTTEFLADWGAVPTSLWGVGAVRLIL